MENTDLPVGLAIIATSLLLIVLFSSRHWIGKRLEGYAWYRKMQEENRKHEEERWKRDEVIDIHDRWGS